MDEHATKSPVGTWNQGQERLAFAQDGTYAWEMPLSCDIPPCPLTHRAGTYAVDDSTIILSTLEGPLSLKFRLIGDPPQLALRSDALAREWLLTLRK